MITLLLGEENMKKIKLFLIPILFLLLITSCANSPEFENSSNTFITDKSKKLPLEIECFLEIDWRNEYKRMKTIINPDGFDGSIWGIPMYFCDIDNDGIFELLAGIQSYARGNDVMFVYDFTDGCVEYKGSINGGFSALKENIYEPEEYAPSNIVDIYRENGEYLLLSCVNYAVGGIYGYSFYLNRCDDSGVYSSVPIGSVYAETENYTPPFEWIYTLGDIASPTVKKDDFEDKINQIRELESIKKDTLKTCFYADIYFCSPSPGQDRYEEDISHMKDELMDYFD